MQIARFDFGKRVRSCRENKGVPARKMSADLEVSPSYVHRIEKEGEIPSAKLIAKIAQYLGISEKDLLILAFKEKALATHKKLIEQYHMADDSVDSLLALARALGSHQQ